MRASPFSLEASCTAGIVQSEKFVRPDLRRTGILCYGLAGWKYQLVKRACCSGFSLANPNY